MSTISESLQILNIDGKNIGTVEVKYAYRRLMRKWHPDRFQLPKDILNATRRSQEINNAYEILTEYIEINGPIQISASQIKHTSLARTASPNHIYANRTFTPGFPDEAVFEVFVKSSHIVSAGYNPHSRKMYIKFDRGEVYEYSKVPGHVWDEFMMAESHGKYAHKYIYWNFSYQRCTESNKPYNPNFAIVRNSKSGYEHQ